MPYSDVVIIGAGQAGLAMSRELAALGIDHVLLERGRVAERWRSSTWDSLRLLTQLDDAAAGLAILGPDQNGFMGRDELVRIRLDLRRTRATPQGAQPSHERGVRPPDSAGE